MANNLGSFQIEWRVWGELQLQENFAVFTLIGEFQKYTFFICLVNLEILEVQPTTSFTKYFRLTISFMWNSASREKFTFYFSGDFTSTDNISISWEGLSTNSMKLLDFLDVSYFSKILCLRSFGNSLGNSYIPVYYY